MKRDHFTYCKQCMVQTHWNCHLFSLVISNFTLCYYTASYIHCKHFLSLTCTRNILILVLSVGIWSYAFLPALSTSFYSSFSYPIPSLWCRIVPTATQSWSCTNNSYKIKKKEMKSAAWDQPCALKGMTALQVLFFTDLLGLMAVLHLKEGTCVGWEVRRTGYSRSWRFSFSMTIATGIFPTHWNRENQKLPLFCSPELDSDESESHMQIHLSLQQH